MSQHKVILLLGSNLGDQKKNIDTAISYIEEQCAVVEKTDYLTSDPVEFVSSNIFCNIAVIITTYMSPVQLLNYVKSIEYKMGRTADTGISGKYTDRTIDIDIVRFNSLKFSSERLNLPHQKHLFEREFSKNLLKQLHKKTNNT